MTTQLPLELETMVSEYSASRSVEWFTSNYYSLLGQLSSYQRRSFKAIFKMPKIPIAERVDLYKTVFAIQVEFDPIEQVNLEMFLHSLETNLII